MTKSMSFTEISPVLVVNRHSVHADEIAEVEVLENMKPVRRREHFSAHTPGMLPALVADVNEQVDSAHVGRCAADAPGQRNFTTFDYSIGACGGAVLRLV